MNKHDILKAASTAAACLLTAASLTSCGSGSNSMYSSQKTDSSYSGGNYSYAAAVGLMKSVVSVILVMSSNKIAHALGEPGLY